LHNESLYRLTQLDEELKAVQAEEESAVSSTDYQRAAELKAQKCALVEQINALDAAGVFVDLTVEDVAGVIEDWTNIPVKRIGEAESAKLLQLEARLRERVVGQNEAVEAVAKAIRRNRARLSKKRKPVSFIFVGPTGVGKTELAKSLAEAMFDSEEALIRVDMSEYMEKHAVSKLIGAPPGYVGYDDAGQLTEKVRRKPYSIILLDEIEKAHAEVFNILLQILDDGRVTDAQGRVVNFENAVIIMTSNAGSDLKTGSYGFARDENASARNKADAALREIFRPEFLNRVDETVAFNRLSASELARIVDMMLKELANELKARGVVFEASEAAKALVLEKGADAKYGARPLRRYIEKTIENAVAQGLIAGEIFEGDSILADAESGEILVRKKNAQ
jgi:ATP-dependent Clp protease ATP-binding subunit ClpE